MCEFTPDSPPAAASLRDRVLFTARKILIIGGCPVLLLVALPFLSPNEVVRGWSIGQTLELAGSVLCGPLAVASSIEPSPIFAAVLLGCVLAYPAWGAKATKALTIFGVSAWMFFGLACTFADV